MSELIKSEYGFPSFLINEIAETAPSENNVRQWAYTGRDFAMWSEPGGFGVRLGDQRMSISIDDARLVRDWLRSATHDIPRDHP